MNWWILVGIYLLIMIGVFLHEVTARDDQSMDYHMRKFAKEMEDLKIAIGEALLPAMGKTIKQMDKFIDAWKKGEIKNEDQ